MKTKCVLLLYYYYHHHNMVERLATSMKEYGVLVDVLCMDHLHLVKNSDVQYGWCTQRVLSLFKGNSKNLVPRVLRRLFASSMLKSIINHYDLIDFHVFSLDYLPYMMFCIKQGIPFDISLWGSDIMRAKKDALVRKKWGFEHCRYIKCTENLHQVLAEKYSTAFDSKVRYVYWGNSDFEVIDTLPASKVKAFKDGLLIHGEEFVVTCGYNGSEGQNHLEIVDAIKGLKKDLKSRISFLFPMTYGGVSEYMYKVKRALDEADVHYTIIDKYISSEEIAAIRLASDVVVNIQKTDAFSGSLQGHLYCNNVLIIGEWLDYVPLDNANVYYIKTSIEDIRDNLVTVLSNLSEYKEKCSGNHEKMAGLTSWSAVLPRWAEYYLS